MPNAPAFRSLQEHDADQRKRNDQMNYENDGQHETGFPAACDAGAA